MAEAPTRVAVIGAGAFGRNHLRVYRELETVGLPVMLVAVVDADEAVRADAQARYAIPGFATVKEFLASGIACDAASVCVPTVHHAAVATPLLEQGLDLLIEKPLAATLADADAVLSLASQHRRIVQVGHLERFNPAVTAARTLLNRPMFFEAHRLSIFTARSLDVDVVLDLMIHDLDVVLSLVDSQVREVRAVGLPVLSRTADIANVRVEFENGCVANFTASRVSTERVRKLRFFQPHQYLSLDFARQDLLLIDVTATAGLSDRELAEMIEKHSKPEQPGEPKHPTAGLNMSKVPVAPGEPLRLELEAFITAVRSRETPLVDGVAGRKALALALEINAAIATHARRVLPAQGPVQQDSLTRCTG
jgi:predicted dehydrogenase